MFIPPVLNITNNPFLSHSNMDLEFAVLHHNQYLYLESLLYFIINKLTLCKLWSIPYYLKSSFVSRFKTTKHRYRKRRENNRNSLNPLLKWQGCPHIVSNFVANFDYLRNFLWLVRSRFIRIIYFCWPKEILCIY